MPEHTETEFRRGNKYGHRSRTTTIQYFMSRPRRYTPPRKYKKIRTGKTYDIEASHTPKLVERLEAKKAIHGSLRHIQSNAILMTHVIDSYLNQ
jgi:hypothetical protein